MSRRLAWLISNSPLLDKAWQVKVCRRALAFLCLSLAAMANAADEKAAAPVNFSTHAGPSENIACFADIRSRASAAKLRPSTIDQVLAAAKIEKKIVQLDRQQAEFTTGFTDYIGRRVTETRADKGRELRSTHSDLLERLTRQYGIPGHYLLAFWGLETNFGSYMGKKNAPSALATLACDGRRAEFFKSELLALMRLVERYQLNPRKMESSWAGALGQTQFMPTTYERYAVDGDNDGKIDLWNSTADALASGANYLAELGWQKGLRWGRRVEFPNQADWSQTGREQTKSLQDWRSIGVKQGNGKQLPNIADINGAVVAPLGHTGPAFLVYHNFNIIMDWNRSELYALSVGLLADRIAGAPPLALPSTDTRLRKDDLKNLQAMLTAKGFNAGPADGILGSGTRIAIRNYQLKHGLVADGYPNSELLQRLSIASAD